MDVASLIIDNGNSIDPASGVPEQLPLPGMEGLSLDEENATLRSVQLDSMSDGISELQESEAVQSSKGKVEDESIICEESKSSDVCQVCCF